MDAEDADRLMAAALFRRNPDYARLRRREQIERAVEEAMGRLRERRAWLGAYETVVTDLLGNGWARAVAGVCDVCGGDVCERDLNVVLDELEADQSGDIRPRTSGPALVCPVGHISHVTCVPFELDTAPGRERVVGHCAVCAGQRR